MPLSHPPGHAQADFGEALAIIGGVERKIHFLVMDLPHSDACFLKAYPAETTEAFCDAHVAAFAFFGGVPVSILYDNTRIAVARILGTGNANEPGCSPNWCPIICLRIDLAVPARGMTKAKSRGWWGTLGATSWCPSPGLPALMISMPIWPNSAASAWMTNCAVTKARLVNGLRVMRERLQPLPAVPYDACDKQSVRVSSLSLVRYRGNDYSVPTPSVIRKFWCGAMCMRW